MIIDGKTIAQEILESLKNKIKENNLKSTLGIILVGSNPESLAYINRKKKAGSEIGVQVNLSQLPENSQSAEVETVVAKLNKDSKTQGIIIQLPLPKHLNSARLVRLISRDKDVDGLVPGSTFIDATAQAVMELLKSTGVKIEGAHAVVVGRSDLVGKPTALLLLKENATVTICHSKTKNLADITAQADILVAAIGKPKFITANMVKKGAVVIDVGINKVGDKLVGDVDFDSVSKVASSITPVPGGVGPMTVAMLMSNLVKASFSQKDRPATTLQMLAGQKI